MPCVLQEEMLIAVDQAESGEEETQASQETQDQLEAIQESMAMNQGPLLSAEERPEKAFDPRHKRMANAVPKQSRFHFLPAGRLADHLLFPILQEKLNSKPCAHQGFVLDGFPETYEQAKMIFLGRFSK